MKRLRIGLVQWALLGIVAVFQAGAQASRIPPSQLAGKLGISVQQLHSLEGKFSLSDEQVVALSAVQLQLMLEDLEHPGTAKHEEQQQFQALKMMDEHGHIAPDGLTRAMEHRKHLDISPDLFPATPDPSLLMPSFGSVGPQVAGIQSGGWTWLGPGNIGGRVRSLLVHPTVTSTLWCGGVDGGVWKSTNSGTAWFPLNDFMANLAIASLALDPTNPNVLYAGTGEAMYNADAIRGAGIFKSTDGGTTWYQLPATANSSYQYVGRLAICPTNNLVILAATRSGIFRSTNGGTNWTQRLGTECVDIMYHPTDGSQAIASGYDSRAFYSTDAGQTWTAASGLPALSGFVVGRVELAYAPSSPTTVYASVDNNSGEIYVSGDGGQSYTLANTGKSYLSSQGWYDNVIWVDPTTPSVLVVGGVDLWRSTDGGVTLTRISQWQSAPNSAHADHHAIVSVPNYNGTSVRTVYFGDDGGVYRAGDIYSVSLTSGWQSLNNNLGITQFYGGAGNVSSGTIVGGTQDNGSLRYTPGGGPQGWTSMFGGDGGFSAADPTNPNYFYGEYVYLQIHRSVNGGASSSYIDSGITDAGSGSTANFIAPYILDPNNANTMLGGGNSLWRSTNVKAGSPNWSAIKGSIGSPISAIAVAPGNSDVIWVGHNSGAVYSTANGTAASPTWTLRSAALPGRYCGRLAINPFNSNKVYATFGGYNTGNVWRTPDGGVTWSDISGNLPAAPVNSIVIAPGVTNTLYVGTDVGIYGTTADGGTWSTGNDGPANVATDELFWMSNKLVAVTHGRGAFSITPALGGANLVGAGSTVLGGNGNGLVDPNECNQLYLVLQNLGGATASNLTATLTTTTPGVTIVQGVSGYPDAAAAGGTVTNITPFQLSTAPDFICGTPVSVALTFAYNLTNSSSVVAALPASGNGYSLVTSAGASIVPGTTDTGNHGDDVVTTISLPFSWTFYGQSFSNAALSSNGDLQFLTSNNAYNNVCLPNNIFNYAIYPLWDDLRTDGTGGGIFTSVSGSAPNRIFNIEWRATFYSSGLSANFEVRLYEGQTRFDLVYGTLNSDGSTATVGAQSDTGSSFLSYECNSGGLSSGLQLSFQPPCTDGGGTCVVVPVVSFTGSPSNGIVPLTVAFTNFSSGATNYSWDFGDGNTSSAANPANTYTNAGVYSVNLTAIGPGGTNSLTRADYIIVSNPPPTVANFTASPTNGVAALAVAFTNLSTGATNYSWDFGDGNTSFAANPANTYTNAGIYTVSLTAIGAGGTNILTRANYIVVTNAPPPLANFTANPTTGTAPLAVAFLNLSSGATNYSWDFGDGYTSTAANPAKTYTNAGVYTVSLIAVGPGGTNGLSRANYIVVTNPPPPMADFTATPTNGLAPLTVVFTNLTSGATNYGWDFGDGKASSVANPTNIYTNAGIYTVSLTAIGPGGTNILTRANYIVVTNAPPPLANFTANPTTGAAPLAVAFLNLSSGATNYSWDFGDGDTSTAADPANTYTNAGVYTVSLTAIGPGGTNSFMQASYIIVTNPPPAVADFTASPTNGLAPLTVVFTNLSSGATNYSWDFGDGNTSSVTNPTNTYTNAGAYTVSLTAIGPGGTNILTHTNNIVVTNAPAQLVVAPTSLDFGMLFIGTTAQASFVLSNAGGVTLTGSAALSGAPFAFAPGAQTQLSIPALGSTNLAVTFAPLSSGVFSNAVLFVTDGGNSTNAVVGVGADLPLILWPAQSGTNFVFSFATLSNKTYTVQYKDVLDDSPWQNAEVLIGDGTTNLFTTPAPGSAQRFYRLSVP